MENILLEIKNELSEMRKQMANMATKADVADIPLIKQAVLETRQELATITDGMKIDIQELKENDTLFEEILLHQRKLIDILTIKTTDHEAQLKWVR